MIGFSILINFLGELSRTHSKIETVKHIANIQVGSMVFHAIAPLSPILFQWVDFKLFGMEINQYNAIGLFMILITFVYQTIAYFFLTNLTQESGYQIFLKLEGLQDENSMLSKDQHQPASKDKLLTLKETLMNFDIDLILVGVSMAGFMCCQFEVCINIMAVINFRWTVNFLGVVSLIAIFTSAILMKIFSRLNSGVSVNYQSALLLIIFSILINLLSLPMVFQIHERSREIAFIMGSLILYLVAGYNIRYLSTNLLFTIVPLHSRCFIIGIREVVFKASIGLGYLTASFLFKVGTISYPIMSSICLLITSLRLWRSPQFLRKYIFASKSV